MDTLEGSGTTPGGPVEFTPMSYMAFLILSFLEMRVLFNMLTLQPWPLLWAQSPSGTVGHGHLDIQQADPTHVQKRTASSCSSLSWSFFLIYLPLSESTSIVHPSCLPGCSHSYNPWSTQRLGCSFANVCCHVIPLPAHSYSFPLHLKWITNSLPWQVPSWAGHLLSPLCSHPPAPWPFVCFSLTADLDVTGSFSSIRLQWNTHSQSGLLVSVNQSLSSLLLDTHYPLPLLSFLVVTYSLKLSYPFTYFLPTSKYELPGSRTLSINPPCITKCLA